MTSLVNVNLKPCTCHPDWPEHHPRCPGTTVLLPCPVRRSVTVSVVLGECQYLSMCGHTCAGHHPDCPARPVRVSCSIAGTWAESEVADLDTPDRDTHLWQLCRDRWGIVKALVLGETPHLTGTEATDLPVIELMEQRDTVFAALADMARAEEALGKAWDACPENLRKKAHPGGSPSMSADRPSGWMLGAYVERLVEQVGSMP